MHENDNHHGNGECGRQQKDPLPQRFPCPAAQNLRMCHVTWQRDFADVDKVKSLETGRLLGITQVGRWNHNVILTRGRRKHKRRLE